MIRDERGAGSVIALAVVSAVVLVSAVLVPLLAVLVQSQRAAGAADAAALAAADAMSGAISGDPCALAGLVAGRNGAVLLTCDEVASSRAGAPGGAAADAYVVVALEVLGFQITAEARAGPPRARPVGDRGR